MTDYCSPANVLDYLDLSTGDSVAIARKITAASRAFDKATGRTFGASVDSSRTYYVERDVEDYTLYFDQPFSSITSITNGDGDTVTASNYILEPRDIPYFKARMKPTSTQYWTNGTDYTGIVVTGVVGYPLTDDIRQAITVWAAFLYRQKDNPLIDITAIEAGAVIQTPNRPKYTQSIINLYMNRGASG